MKYMDCTKFEKGLRLNIVPGDPRNLELQIHLSKPLGVKKKVYYTGLKDAIFGPMMDAAVRNYQKDNGLVVDGVAGPVTLEHMGLCSKASVVVNASAPNVHVGATSKRKNDLKVLVFNQKSVPNYGEVSCGPVSICMGLSIDDVVTKANFQSEVRKLINAGGTNNNGTVPERLDAAVNQVYKGYEMKPYKYENMAQIADAVDKHKGVVLHGATISEMGYSGSFGHYIFLKGYDYDNNKYNVVDPHPIIQNGKWVMRNSYWYNVNVIKKFIDKRGHVTPIHVLKKIK
jgi:peptidoglycan hydrolase-like protein with peptidoglycan-binding domain